MSITTSPSVILWGNSRRISPPKDLLAIAGTGGPRWIDHALHPETPIVRLQQGDRRLADAFDGITGGTQQFRVAATGAAAARFLRRDTATTVTLRIDTADPTRRIFRDANGGTLLARIDGPAWRIQTAHNASSPLLTCLQLGLCKAPLTRLPGLWWCTEVPARSRTQRIARLFGLSPPIRCFGRFGADTQGTIALETRVKSAGAGLPSAISVRIAATHGIIAIKAEFRDGALHFERL